MADPLTQVTDQFAPAPLNFFDKGQAQSITARYGVARRGAAVTDELAQSRARAQNMEIDRERQERSRILADREDLEYADKLTNREERAGFFGDLMEFDHTAPDASTRYTELLKGIAERTPALLEDPAVKEAMTWKSRQIDKEDDQRRQNQEIGLRQQNALQLQKERDKMSPLLSNLTPEDHAAAPKDENGEPMREWLVNKAWERKTEREMNTYGKKTEIRKEAAIDILNLRNMDKDQEALYKDTKDVVINNKRAFPTQMSSVQGIARGKKVPDAVVEDPKKLAMMPEYTSQVAEALEWDKNQFENEVLTARKAKSKDDYVNLVKGLTPFDKRSREQLYDAAVPTDSTPSAPSAPTPATEAPATPQIKILDGVTYVKKPGGGWVAVKGK